MLCIKGLKQYIIDRLNFHPCYYYHPFFVLSSYIFPSRWWFFDGVGLSVVAGAHILFLSKTRYQLYKNRIDLKLLTGCLKDSDVTDELIEYHNNYWITYQVMKENNIESEMSAITSFLLKDDLQAIKTLYEEDDIDELVNYLEGIELENKELKQLNQLQIEIELSMYDKYEELIEEIDNKNAKKMEVKIMNFYILGEEQDNEFDEKREKLMDKYDVKWIKEYDEDGNTIKKMQKKDN